MYFDHGVIRLPSASIFQVQTASLVSGSEQKNEKIQVSSLGLIDGLYKSYPDHRSVDLILLFLRTYKQILSFFFVC